MPISYAEIAFNLSFGFISLILRGFSLSSRAFYLRNGHLTIPCDKKPKNLSEISYENQQNKPKTQVFSVDINGTHKAPDGLSILQRE